MQNLSEILNSQTNLKGIDKDIQRLKKAQSIWLELMNTPVNTTTALNPAIFEKSAPIRYHNNTLNIVCDMPLLANHLRYNKEALIKILMKKGLKNIDSISISVTNVTEKQNHNSRQEKVTREVNSTTISTLEQFQRSCSSEPLGSSIKKLIQQLKNSEKR